MKHFRKSFDLVIDQQFTFSFSLHYEKQRATEQLEKLRLLLKYFHEKLSEDQLTTIVDSSAANPLEEQSILYPDNSVEYKKEFSADILDKYAGKSANKKEQAKKHRRKGKVNPLLLLLSPCKTIFI